MNLSDTIAVIYDGNIVNTFKQGTVDEKTIGLLMAGGKKFCKRITKLLNNKVAFHFNSHFYWFFSS